MSTNPITTGVGPDPTTRRAEEIREATGVPWEIACGIAEYERDNPHARNHDYCTVAGPCHAFDCSARASNG